MDAEILAESLPETVSGSEATCEPVAHVISRRVIWFRTLRGLTQAQLARSAGLSRSAVNSAESGQSEVTIRTLLALAVALRTSPAALLGSDDPSADDIAQSAQQHRF